MSIHTAKKKKEMLILSLVTNAPAQIAQLPSSKSQLSPIRHFGKIFDRLAML